MHLAELDSNNTVLRVISCDSKEWAEQNLGGTWVETFMKTPGKNHAAVGHKYHPDVDNFSAPQPLPSWTLDDNLIWQPPVPYPQEDELVLPEDFAGVTLSILEKLALQYHREKGVPLYRWNEDSLSWVQSSSP